MKARRIGLRNFTLYFLFCLSSSLMFGLSNPLVSGCTETPWLRDPERPCIDLTLCLSQSLNHESFQASQEPTDLIKRTLEFSSELSSQKETMQHSSLDQTELSQPSLFEVASLGAATTGSLVEGSIGSIHKGCRHRFYCHSTELTGFLGPKTTTKPLALKDQPGVFPAPLIGAASVTFNFKCQDANAAVTPIVVRPDGTVFQGLSMTSLNSPQTLVISSPAQTGIYTLFVLANQKEALDTHVTVNASISTQPQNDMTFHLKSFEGGDKNAELISAEFVYAP